MQEIASPSITCTVNLKNTKESWYSLFSSNWSLISSSFMACLMTSASTISFLLGNWPICSFNPCIVVLCWDLSCSIYWFRVSCKVSFSFWIFRVVYFSSSSTLFKIEIASKLALAKSPIVVVTSTTPLCGSYNDAFQIILLVTGPSST